MIFGSTNFIYIGMASYLSPAQLSKDSLRFSSKNYRNHRLHHALDEAKNYSDMVNVHLLRSKQENHVLSSAAQAYQGRSMSRTMSSSLGRNFAARVKRIYSTKQLLKNPEVVDMVPPITSKAENIPTIGEKFKESLEHKMFLDERARQLKNLINQERKAKDKLYIKNCRLLNAIESSQKQIRIMGEHSQKDNILISETQSECHDLLNDLRSLDRESTKTKKRIEEESSNVVELTKIVYQDKRELEVQSHELQHLKYRQSVAYKNMTNDHMFMNQKKEEKALFLNHIRMDVARNS